ncbi:hypothetical protein M427DRAFT_29392 [Gonapodya prolifera JEL478]|uniref:FAD-binding FR-type domain-containing protein n=1 Tax=Gonapodya prolifera (strain JEL478) TaxID=1344416 RepID=A0A139AQE7_GONPJ|nr:hypothetical protein M427DRAFT_29392 [Gonapodya prolifera JEL478]|eukprot:KXS18948.1 hypothetical protein M427DRAFT_29392 [Gonapodya prolifera JEL478]
MVATVAPAAILVATLCLILFTASTRHIAHVVRRTIRRKKHLDATVNYWKESTTIPPPPQGLGEFLQLTFYTLLNLLLLLVPTSADYAGQTLEWSIGRRSALLGMGNGFFVVVCATRNSVVTVLTGVPFERTVAWHRWCGKMCWLMLTIHTSCFLQFYDLAGPVIDYFSDDPSNRYGLAAWLALSLLTLLSHSLFRRRFFRTFYYSHAVLTPLYFALGALHVYYRPGSPSSFLAFSGPGLILYAADRLLRRWKSSVPVPLADMAVLGSDAGGGRVIRLSFRHPMVRNEAGQYVFLCAPAMAWLEWYPFTISSEPDLLESNLPLTVHIKSLGDWTRHLHREAHRRLAEGDAAISLRVDGPYGRSSVDFCDAGVVVLFGGGVGITPMIAVAGDVVARMENGLAYTVHSVTFIWCVHHPDQLSWFADALVSLRARALALPAGFSASLRVHLTRGRWGNTSLHPDEAKDLLREGRPDAKTVLREMRWENPGEDVAVGVCGPKGMVREVRNAAAAESDGSGTFRTRRGTHDSLSGSRSLRLYLTDLDDILHNAKEGTLAQVEGTFTKEKTTNVAAVEDFWEAGRKRIEVGKAIFYVAHAPLPY